MASGSKGSDAKVPAKYLSYMKSMSDASTNFIEVRPITPPFMDITGNGNNMLSFSIPNNNDQFLLSDSLYLSGFIQTTIASTDVLDTFTVLEPGIPRIFTILQQHRFKVGGQLVDECTNDNLNCLHWNCKTNSLEDLQIQPFGDGNYIAGAVAPAYRAFRIPIQQHDSFLFGTSRTLRDPSAADVHAIPMWMLPKNQLDFFFDLPINVVSRANVVPAGTLTPSYQLQNLHLETYWLTSPSLAQRVKSQGWSAVFRSSLPLTLGMSPVGANTKITIQIPTAFNSVSHIMAVIQRPADLISLTNGNRKFLGSNELGIPNSTQVRVNSIQVFQEPLQGNGSDLQRELNKIHPESRTSSFVMNGFYAAVNGAVDSRNLIYGLKVGRDYEADSGGLLSGYPTMAASGSILVEFQFSNAIITQSVLNAWVTYARYFQVSPNGAINVKY